MPRKATASKIPRKATARKIRKATVRKIGKATGRKVPQNAKRSKKEKSLYLELLGNAQERLERIRKLHEEEDEFMKIELTLGDLGDAFQTNKSANKSGIERLIKSATHQTGLTEKSWKAHREHTYKLKSIFSQLEKAIKNSL